MHELPWPEASAIAQTVRQIAALRTQALRVGELVFSPSPEGPLSELLIERVTRPMGSPSAYRDDRRLLLAALRGFVTRVTVEAADDADDAGLLGLRVNVKNAFPGD